MTTLQFVAHMKKNFATLPTKKQFKEYMWKNNVDVNLSSDKICEVLKRAYAPKVIEKSTNRIYEKEIKDLMDLGYTHLAIADKLNLNSCQLSILKDKYGLSKKRITKRLEQDSLQYYFRIYEHYEKTKSFRKTAEHFNIDPSTVKKRVEKVKKYKEAQNG